MQLDVLELGRIQEEPRECSYIPDRFASLDHRFFARLDAQTYGQLMARGWRRFGQVLFRPKCPSCHACVSLRVPTTGFTPSSSQRRTLRRNAHIDVVVQRPSVTDEHVRLFNAYHEDMHHRRGWPLEQIDATSYALNFLQLGGSYAHEFLYFDDGTLVGVGLVDIVPDALSSAYFYHDPAWRPLAPGVFSLLKEIEYARDHGRPHHYLGYWIDNCKSMSYKADYKPHELLDAYPDDDAPPVWRPGAEYPPA